MKNLSSFKRLVPLIFLASGFFACVPDIKVELDVTGGGLLEDAILIVSDNGSTPRDAYRLGDIDLSLSEVCFNHSVDTSLYTHWWLIGSMGGDVVYSSVVSLAGVDIYTIEPYTGAELAWIIPNNLDGFINETGYSLDWWAQTVNNHSSHVTENKVSSVLWKFNNGQNIGTIYIDLAVYNCP